MRVPDRLDKVIRERIWRDELEALGFSQADVREEIERRSRLLEMEK